MLLKSCAPIAAVVCLASSTTASAADPAAVAVLRAGLTAQGGEARLRALKTLRVETIGYRNLLEQSERPQGPYIPELLTGTETRDHQHGRFREEVTNAVYPNGEGFEGGTAITVVADGIAMRGSGASATPGDGLQVRIAAERLALSPERLLLTALDAPDARLEAPVQMQGIVQDVIGFRVDGAPVRLFLNRFTHLPTAFDYSGPWARTGFFAYTGDAVRRSYLSLWTLTDQGVSLPLQSDIVVNGLPDRTVVVSKLTVDAALPEDAFAIPAAVKAAFHPGSPARTLETLPLGSPATPAQELAPGVVFIPGRWNVTLVRQDDGVVVLDAPISSGYSAQVLAEAARRFPGLPVKAVVSTSDAWPHIAGLREYVARGIPIYALDLNRPAILRIVHAAHTAVPDRLQRAPRAPILKVVAGRMLLGSGANRLELYPVRGETSERQVMGYFPQRRLLYGSDVFQQDEQRRFTFTEQVLELAEAVQRHHLTVERLIMMHLGPIPWTQVTASLPRCGHAPCPAS